MGARDTEPCYYCGDPATTIDHVVPVSWSAELSDHELAAYERLSVPACQSCNSRAGVTRHASLAERVAFVKSELRVWQAIDLAAADVRDRLIREGRTPEQATQAMADVGAADQVAAGDHVRARIAWEPPALDTLPPDLTIDDVRREAAKRAGKAERANDAHREAMRARRQETKLYGHALTAIPGRRNPRTMTVAQSATDPEWDGEPIDVMEARVGEAEAAYLSACYSCPNPPSPADIARLDDLKSEYDRLDDELQAMYDD